MNFNFKLNLAGGKKVKVKKETTSAFGGNFKLTSVAPGEGRAKAVVKADGTVSGKRVKKRVDYKELNNSPIVPRKPTLVRAPPKKTKKERPKKIAPSRADIGYQRNEYGTPFPKKSHKRKAYVPKSQSRKNNRKKAVERPPPKKEDYGEAPFLPVDFDLQSLRPVRPVVSPQEPNPQMVALQKELQDVDEKVKNLRVRLGELQKDKKALARESAARRKALNSSNRKFRRSYSERQELSSSGRRRKRSSRFDSDSFSYDGNFEESEFTPSDKSSPRGRRKRLNRSAVSYKSLSGEMEACCKMLDYIMDKEIAEPFCAPVDPAVFTDYATIVQRPMDFRTIRQNILEAAYQDVMAVTDDLDQVVENCIAYNGPDAGITYSVKKLKGMWGSRVRRIRNTFHPELKPQPQKRQRKKKGKAQPPMEWDEKKELVFDIQQLPPEQIAAIVQIVSEDNPKDMEGGDEEGGEVELDLASMPDSTLRKLQAHVKKFKRSKQGREIKKQEKEHQQEEEEEEEKKKKQKKRKRRAQRRQVIEDTDDVEVEEETVDIDLETLKKRSAQTTQNTVQSIQEIQDELARLAGRVIEKDHVSSVNTSLYSLDPETIALDASALPLDSSDSDDSDTVSGEEEGEGGKAPKKSKAPKDGWDLNTAFPSKTPTYEGGSKSNLLGEGLLSEFANRDEEQKKMEEEKERLKEELRERERREEEERRRQEAEKREKAAAEERLRREEAERQRKEKQEERERDIERERERERRKREEMEQEVTMSDQQDIMGEFESGWNA